MCHICTAGSFFISPSVNYYVKKKKNYYLQRVLFDVREMQHTYTVPVQPSNSMPPHTPCQLQSIVTSSFDRLSTEGPRTLLISLGSFRDRDIAGPKKLYARKINWHQNFKNHSCWLHFWGHCAAMAVDWQDIVVWFHNKLLEMGHQTFMLRYIQLGSSFGPVFSLYCGIKMQF